MGIGIIGIDMPNCLHMPFKLRAGVLNKILPHI